MSQEQLARLDAVPRARRAERASRGTFTTDDALGALMLTANCIAFLLVLTSGMRGVRPRPTR